MLHGWGGEIRIHDIYDNTTTLGKLLRSKHSHRSSHNHNQHHIPLTIMDIHRHQHHLTRAREDPKEALKGNLRVSVSRTQ